MTDLLPCPICHNPPTTRRVAGGTFAACPHCGITVFGVITWNRLAAGYAADNLRAARRAITRRLEAESAYLQDHIRVWAADPNTPKELRSAMRRVQLVIADCPGVETGMIYCDAHGFQPHIKHECVLCRAMRSN